MTNARWALRDAEQMLPWKSCFYRGDIWNHPGRWALASQDSLGAMNLRTICAALNVPVEETQGQVRLTASADLLPSVLLELARHPEVALSHELQLLLRIERLAAVIVDEADVMAFAAPSGVTYEEIVAVCDELGIPDEGAIGRWTSRESFVAAWLPTWAKAEHRALRRLFVSEAVRFEYGEQVCGESWSSRWTESKSTGASVPESGATWAAAELWVDAWLWTCVDQFVRQTVAKAEVEEATAIPSGPSYRIMYRGEAEVLDDWETALVHGESEFKGDGWLVWRTLKQAFQSAGWSKEGLHNPSGRAFYHLEFRLVPPDKGLDGDSWRLEYWLVHNHWPVRNSLRHWWQQPIREWLVGRDLLREPDTWFLPKLAEAGAVVPAIAESLMQPRPDAARIRAEDVYDFLSSDLVRLEEMGCHVEVPSIQKMGESDIRIRVEVRRPVTRSTRGGVHTLGSNRWFDTDQLVDFDWKIALGDTQLSAEEFNHMVAERSPLIQLGGSWKLVPLDAVLAQMEELRKSAEHIAGGSLMDVARMVLLTEQAEAEVSDVSVEVDFTENARDVEELVRALLGAARPQPIGPPASFQGTLRNYQQLGFEWLVHLRNIGCGCVLADDMGLGKTIQILAYWSHLWENHQTSRPHLLVCPTSLLQNWRAELVKFTPDLRVYVHHGAARIADAVALQEIARNYDVVMTTYATAVRDAEALTAMTWDTVVVDEAQNVKNPETKQAQVVCQLQASQRIALTGTPVENRLEELWSIFRFAVPGYLGGLTWFRRQYVDPIVNQNVPYASQRLHQLLQPVLMRRSKMDPTIQLELPEKWEVREYSGLTSEQGALYQSIVNRLFTDIEGKISGMSRRGQILTALVRLKQICDHPCLSVGGSASVDRSGKLKLLLDLLDDAIAEGEAALVFTQFRGMGEILCEAIEQRFGTRPQFLHGGLTAGARGEMVDAFQNGRDVSRVLVLSLKAGGVGLNLTRANHVFHYDRWWNPAVEDQATDRVFRIGQTRNVQVHKLVCPGTLEERIDELIRTKRSLSSVVVGESEGWLTEMDNQSLRTLFELDSGSAVEEGDDW